VDPHDIHQPVAAHVRKLDPRIAERNVREDCGVVLARNREGRIPSRAAAIPEHIKRLGGDAQRVGQPVAVEIDEAHVRVGWVKAGRA